uniref:zinc finger protein 57 homolog n=1 Tax=Myodes glareolus TaxID=447135 RepID=UPI0020222212|nr:zinc finger protein 57 homolog [Myodes glareolus]
MGSKKQSAQSLQRPVTYEDVAVDFTNEEWACLTEKQKILYRKVQSETFKNLTFVDQYAMQKERRQKRSGLCPTKAIGSKKRNSQGPSSNLEDEESNDKEKASLVCTGMFKGGPLYFCLTCGKCYKKYINLFNHQFKAQKTTRHKVRAAKPQHRRERTFSCQLCNKNYRDPSGLSRHRRTHLGYRPSSCSVCGKRFRDQSEVKRHMKVHENRKPVTGNQEHEVKKVPLTTAGSQGPNLRHVKVIQGPVARAKASGSRDSSLNVRSSSIPVKCSRRNIHCPYCLIRFTKRTCFLTHLKLHFENEPNQCLRCRESSHSSLRCRESSHSSLRCRESSHSSVVVDPQKSTLRKQSIYCCPVCDICFREKESLLDHMCCKESGRPIKCWEILGHLLAFLDDPFEARKYLRSKGVLRGRKDETMKSRKTR